MFESDDYDQVLSQFEFPEEATNIKLPGVADVSDSANAPKADINSDNKNDQNVILHNGGDKLSTVSKQNRVQEKFHECHGSPKHMKRKMINTYFNHKNKRKFPGPAGLLTDSFEENRDEVIYEMELLSQDVDFTQNISRDEIFQSSLWLRLLEDLNDWNLKEVETIKTIKQKSITGSLKRRKAHTVIAFVEMIDRSVTDPLIIMRDTTGNIKGTLHRDVWCAFSQYIASEYCAFILWRPTILTTGAAFKKHYLNITLSNILAIYSSNVLNEVEKKKLLDGYSIIYEVDYTVIKTQNDFHNIGGSNLISNVLDNDTNDLLEGLDCVFSHDIF